MKTPSLNSPGPSPRTASVRSAFTLLELMISIALVLVLMLAITKIFAITSSTIGASQGISAATRDARAAQTVFARDIGAMASDSPFIWIHAGVTISAFRNAADEKSDLDGNPYTIDVNGNGTEGEASTIVDGEIIGNYDIGARNHRLDQFSFCARDRFARQTGNSKQDILVSGLSSAEAWIYYGPLCLPRNDGDTHLVGTAGPKTNPGAGTAAQNPNNFYASQWILGRFAPLMILPVNGDIREGDPNLGVKQAYYPHNASVYLLPFDTDNTQSQSPTPLDPAVPLRTARYDLVGTDISTARGIISDFVGATGWWEQIVKSYFEVDPFVIKPVSPKTTSQQVPIFVPSCSQFIVEFAGDFCTQDSNPASATYGKAAAGPPTPDGVIDFAIKNGQRQIRWYGYPRDTDGLSGISLLKPLPSAAWNPVDNSDTVTVSDFVLPIGSAYSTVTLASLVPFEHTAKPTAPVPVTRNRYAVNDLALEYFAAWGPSDTVRPKMYRITLTIDRPELAGRTPDGQTFEYVFNAP